MSSSIDRMKELAKEFFELNEERDNLNQDEDYKGAFEVECTQRDKGCALALMVLSYFGKMDSVVDNSTMEEIKEFKKLDEEYDKLNDNGEYYEAGDIDSRKRDIGVSLAWTAINIIEKGGIEC